MKKPDDKQVRTEYEKTLALKIMSLDLNTTEKSSYSSNKVKQSDNKMAKIVKHSWFINFGNKLNLYCFFEI